VKIKYDKEANILIFILKDDPPVDAIEEPGGVIISYNDKKDPVSIEILNASCRLHLQPGELNVILQG